MNINQTFKSGEYLKAEDMQGKVHTLQIGEFNHQVFKGKDGKPDECTYYVTIKNRDGARLRLNVGNRTNMADMLGEETDDWADKWFNLRVGKVKFEGKMVPGFLVDSIPPSPSDIEAAKAEVPF